MLEYSLSFTQKLERKNIVPSGHSVMVWACHNDKSF